MNQKGQLGLGHTNTPIASPIQVPLPSEVASFGVGSGTVVTALKDGTIYGFGLNGYGELGAKCMRLAPTVCIQINC